MIVNLCPKYNVKNKILSCNLKIAIVNPRSKYTITRQQSISLCFQRILLINEGIVLNRSH